MRGTSKAIFLTMVASLTGLSACDDKEAKEAKEKAAFEQSRLFADQEACSSVYDATTCEFADNAAKAAHFRDSPHFTSSEECTAQTGTECREAPSVAGVFLPVMAGYMIAKSASGWASVMPVRAGKSPCTDPSTPDCQAANTSRHVYNASGAYVGSYGGGTTSHSPVPIIISRVGSTATGSFSGRAISAGGGSSVSSSSGAARGIFGGSAAAHAGGGGGGGE